MSILAKQRAQEQRPRLHPRHPRPPARRPAHDRATRASRSSPTPAAPTRAAAAEAIARLAKELGLSGLRIAVVTGDDIEADIDELMARGRQLRQPRHRPGAVEVRERLTHAAVYTGCEGIVEALRQGAEIVVCGRVTDIALYLGPLRPRVRLGRRRLAAARDGHRRRARDRVRRPGDRRPVRRRLGRTSPGLEELGYPIAEVSRRRHRRAHQDPRHRRSRRHRDRQRAAGLRDPRPGQLPDRRRHRRLHAGAAGGDRPRPGADHRRRPASRAPATLKVNMGYRAGFIGEAQFTYTWPDAYAKAQRGLAFLRNRLERAGFEYSEDLRRVHRPQLDVGQPDRRARRPRAHRDRGPLRRPLPRRRCRPARSSPRASRSTTTAPPASAGVGTRPPLKELYAIWPCLIPREHVTQSVEILEV